MRNRRRRISQDGGGIPSGQLLSLSLFVMLLAFFIVLNAMSNFQEKKISRGMMSIQGAFSLRPGSMDDENEYSSESNADEKTTGTGSAAESLQQLFTARIPGYKAEVTRSTGTMTISVPFDEFEAAVTEMGKGEAAQDDKENFTKGFFLPAMVSLLRNDSIKIPYEMSAMLNVSDNPARMINQEPQKSEEMLRRLGVVAEKIEFAGLPRKLIAVGLRKGDDGMVDLVFRPHVPFNPLEGSAP